MPDETSARHRHAAMVKARVAKRALAFMRLACTLQFPGMPNIHLASGPWSNAMLQLAEWYERGLTLEEAEAEVASLLNEYRAARGGPRHDNNRAINTRNIIEELRNAKLP